MREEHDLGALVRAARARVTTQAPPRRTPAEADDEPGGSILVRADQATWVRPTTEPARPTHLPPRSVRTRKAHG